MPPAQPIYELDIPSGAMEGAPENLCGSRNHKTLNALYQEVVVSMIWPGYTYRSDYSTFPQEMHPRQTAFQPADPLRSSDVSTRLNLTVRARGEGALDPLPPPCLCTEPQRTEKSHVYVHHNRTAAALPLPPHKPPAVPLVPRFAKPGSSSPQLPRINSTRRCRSSPSPLHNRSPFFPPCNHSHGEGPINARP